MRRLSARPSPDHTCWIVFNGEIYNFRELRSELEALGYAFASMTDTEVLLKSYLHWGERCLSIERYVVGRYGDGAMRVS